MVMLHGCTIGEGSLIGIGAVILNGAKIGKGCLIGAKSLIAENKEIPDYSLVMGVPGKVVRTFTPEEAQMMLKNAVSYQNNWKRFSQGLKKEG
jgi:carbonic anhydrase/acetyltransferase-like protein (isoleucine patch superfamily)